MAKKILKAEDFKAFMVSQIASEKRELLAAALDPSSGINTALHSAISDLFYNFVRDSWDAFVSGPAIQVRVTGYKANEESSGKAIEMSAGQEEKKYGSAL